jgi:hypothetical protein
MSLTLVLIYCRQKAIAARLAILQTAQSTESEVSSHCISLRINHIGKFLKENL